jgi:hypothetical protein
MFPRDMVCPRNKSVDTLHKGDTEDDDDDDDKQPYWTLYTYFGKC